jgi:hypothetical protein
MKFIPLLVGTSLVSALIPAHSQDALGFSTLECAGLSGFRAHWDSAIPVSTTGARIIKDSVVKDRGQTAVWDGVNSGPLAFNATSAHSI